MGLPTDPDATDHAGRPLDLAAIAGRDSAAALLAGFDPGNAVDRQTVFDALDQLVERYLAPAADCRQAGDRFGLFDLGAAAGTELSGLLAGLFEGQLPPFPAEPSDEQLRAALAFVDIAVPDASQRAMVQKCRAANHAALAAIRLVGFLKAPLLSPPGSPALPRSLMMAEREQLATMRSEFLPEPVGENLRWLDQLLSRHIGWTADAGHGD
ncbi:hypothetical protein DFJ74DRAFT_770442 [Hyaloraphidium curvatum]|nr:hypothetical protein DFJ74DRAFT_770442 [Hyaloraphidium curvatum]